MELNPPAHLSREFPVSELASETTYNARNAIHRILHKADDRLVVVIGPCSIHDPVAAREYAANLLEERKKHSR
ncbi:3-deoxy-7-phosphoheptulonate synthase, partial [Acinetobacter baumannii]